MDVVSLCLKKCIPYIKFWLGNLREPRSKWENNIKLILGKWIVRMEYGRNYIFPALGLLSSYQILQNIILPSFQGFSRTFFPFG
jgi:hypothetical protein